MLGLLTSGEKGECRLTDDFFKEKIRRSNQVKTHHSSPPHLKKSLCLHGPRLDLDLCGLKLKVGSMALAAREWFLLDKDPPVIPCSSLSSAVTVRLSHMNSLPPGQTRPGDRHAGDLFWHAAEFPVAINLEFLKNSENWIFTWQP